MIYLTSIDLNCDRPTENIYRIYEVYPLRLPEFRMLAAVSIQVTPRNNTLSTDSMLVIHVNTGFIVWDYLADAWVAWKSNLAESCHSVSGVRPQRIEFTNTP